MLVPIKDDWTKVQNHSGTTHGHTCVLRTLYKAHLRDVYRYCGLGLVEAGKGRDLFVEASGTRLPCGKSGYVPYREALWKAGRRLTTIARSLCLQWGWEQCQQLREGTGGHLGLRSTASHPQRTQATCHSTY